MNAPATPSWVVRLHDGAAELVRLQGGEVAALGRDVQNRVQLAHGSIQPFHATLRCDDWGVWVRALPGAAVAIGGEAVAGEERLVPQGRALELGALRFDVVPAGAALAAAPAATPAVARAFGRTFGRTFDHAVGYLLSAAMHALALWILHRLAGVPEPPSPTLALHSDLVAPPDEAWRTAPESDAAVPELVPEQEPEIEPLQEMPVPDPEPSPAAEAGRAADLALQAGAMDLGLGALGGGEGLSGIGRLSLDDGAGVGATIVSRLQSLRGCGVDVCFVVDTTSSMQPFLHHARTAVDALASQLATLVGDLRLGVVAFRDRDDAYVTRSLPLSGDRYAILNFVWTLRAEGGGDVPEAIAAGLEEAIERGGWRAGTHRVIVVVGDAPPHEADARRIETLVTRFVRGNPQSIPGAVVSAIYTGPRREEVRDPAHDGARALAGIARLGRGDFLDLGPTDLGDRLLWLILGPHHANELRVLLSRVRDGPRERIVRERAAAGDTHWLLAKLRRPPIHPLLIESLLDQADRGVLWEARKLVADGGEPRAVREAALYLLRRAFPLALELDLDRDLELQKGVLDRLDAQILRR